jgi:hypothetical protein
VASHRYWQRQRRLHFVRLHHHRRRFVQQYWSILVELPATTNHLRAKLLSRRRDVH